MWCNFEIFLLVRGKSLAWLVLISSLADLIHRNQPMKLFTTMRYKQHHLLMAVDRVVFTGLFSQAMEQGL